MNAQAMPHKTTAMEAAARPAFGTVLASQMAVTNWKDGKWSSHEFCKYGPIEMSPAIHGLHYGSTCFEGFKAYRWADGSVNIFRMDKHIARMRQSATSLVLPQPDAAPAQRRWSRASSTACAARCRRRPARCTCARRCSAPAQASAARPRPRPRRCWSCSRARSGTTSRRARSRFASTSRRRRRARPR